MRRLTPEEKIEYNKILDSYRSNPLLEPPTIEQYLMVKELSDAQRLQMIEDMKRANEKVDHTRLVLVDNKEKN